jgi:hypothetical protein
LLTVLQEASSLCDWVIGNLKTHVSLRSAS